MGAKEYIIGALAGTLVALVATRGLGPSSNPDSYIGNGSVGVNLRVERNGSACLLYTSPSPRDRG